MNTQPTAPAGIDTASAVEMLADELPKLTTAVLTMFGSTMPTLRRVQAERASMCWESIRATLRQLGARVDDDTLTQLVSRALSWDTDAAVISSLAYAIEHAFDDPGKD